MKHSYIFLLFSSFILNSCVIQKSSNKQDKKQIIILGPATMTCDAGVMQKEYYQVKWTEEQENWEYFYNEIDGFTFEPGYLYKLLVSVESILNPPADASSLKYRLIRVLEKEEVCESAITESEVLQLLKEKDLLLYPKGVSTSEIARTPSYQPKVTYNAATCLWMVVSRTYESTTQEGDCANTNGCTPEIRLTVKVNAQTKEIVNQKEERILHPNYE